MGTHTVGLQQNNMTIGGVTLLPSCALTVQMTEWAGRAWKGSYCLHCPSTGVLLQHKELSISLVFKKLVFTLTNRDEILTQYEACIKRSNHPTFLPWVYQQTSSSGILRANRNTQPKKYAFVGVLV